MKKYLNGKEFKPGWGVKTNYEYWILKLPDGSPQYVYYPVGVCVGTYDQDIPVKLVRSGWNSEHYISKDKR